ncbi:MAG: PEP-CTERM sorting domain-containing protein [Planctomycetota bacterium]|jgi:hypothetical protein
MKTMCNMVFVVSAVLLCGATDRATGELLTDIVRVSSRFPGPEVAGPLEEGSSCYVDADYTYRDIPDELLGAEYVRVAQSDRTSPLYELDVTLSQPATLYLFLDDRLGSTPASGGGVIGGGGMGLGGAAADDPGFSLSAAGMDWVTQLGFADTGLGIGIDSTGDGLTDNLLSVFSVAVPAGTVALLQQADRTGADPRLMYGVAAVPEPATVALLAGGILALRGPRRRRRHRAIRRGTSGEHSGLGG